MTLATNIVTAGVVLLDTYVAANYPGGDADVITDLKDRVRTIATNRGWTINEDTWHDMAKRTYIQGNVEYQVYGNYGDPSNGTRYRVVCQVTKEI